MSRTLEQVFQNKTGFELSVGALRIGLLLGLSGGLCLGHLEKCLLQSWESLEIQQLTSLSNVMFFLTVFTCVSIDLLSSTAGLMVGNVFHSHMGHIFDALTPFVFAWNLTGPVILAAACATGAVLGTVLFSYPWLSGVVSVPLVLLAGTGIVNILVIMNIFFRIPAFPSNVEAYMKHYIDTSVLMYVTSLMVTVSFMALEKTGSYIKISALLNILLPLKLFPSAVGISESSSRKARRVCISAAFWGLLVVSALMLTPPLSPGPSVGAAVRVTTAFRVSIVAAGGAILKDHKEGTSGLTVGATIGAFIAFYFY